MRLIILVAFSAASFGVAFGYLMGFVHGIDWERRGP